MHVKSNLSIVCPSAIPVAEGHGEKIAWNLVQRALKSSA